MKATLTAAAILLVAGTHALAHRLDEYLQGAIISVEKNRIQTQITLTPGVAVFPIVLAGIDTDVDGVITETEQRAYAARVLRDLSLTIDGYRLTPQLFSLQFPTIDEMREGRGEIQLEFKADLPSGGPNRTLVFENHHQSRIAAYQVNCLVPRDPHIRIVAQHRTISSPFINWITCRPAFVLAGSPLHHGRALANGWGQVLFFCSRGFQYCGGAASSRSLKKGR